MTTLAQIALPTVGNLIEFVTVFAGVAVLGVLLYQLVRTRSISPYVGMPALVTVVLMGILVGIGSQIELAALPVAVAAVMGYVTEIVTSAFIWPYLIVALIAQGIRVFQIAAFKCYN